MPLEEASAPAVPLEEAPAPAVPLEEAPDPSAPEVTFPPPGLTREEVPLVPVRPRARRATPPEMVAWAVTLPEGFALTGRPLSLLEALSSDRDGRHRLEATQAYWRLTAAVAEYRFCVGECDRLERLEARPEEAMMLRTARASAAAARQMAELAVVAAQYDLGEAARLPADATLPLCADLPHVGPYQTYFEQIFSSRNPPARIRLIDRTLPIRRREIDVRTTAVHAAEDALEAVGDAYQLGKLDLPAVIASIRQLGGQQRALIASVCYYNHDIAEYAVAVAGPQTSGAELVAMLIRQAPQRDRPLGPEADPLPATRPAEGLNRSAPRSEVQPATLNEPVPAGQRDPVRPSRPGVPTLAPPREESQPSGLPENAPATPGEGAESAEPPAPERPLVPVPPGPVPPVARSVNKPATDAQGVLQAPPGLYPALVDVAPAVRVKHLAMALHWNRTLSEPAGESIELKDCLRGLPGVDRPRVIGAYWLARQRVAEYQVLAGQIELLEELVPCALEQRDAPLGAEAMLLLRAAKLAADADLLIAQMGLMESQLELTRSVGRQLDSAWLLPVTVPHSGPYLLKLEAQPRRLVESWPLRRLAATVPALAVNLQGRAAAVVEADAARAAATATYQAALGPIDDALACIGRQTAETLTFLDTLTGYNQAIADYALTVLPSAIPGDRLVETLVVVR